MKNAICVLVLLLCPVVALAGGKRSWVFVAETPQTKATGCPCSTSGVGFCGNSTCPSVGGSGCPCAFVKQAFVFPAVPAAAPVYQYQAPVVAQTPFAVSSPAGTMPGTTVRIVGQPSTSYPVDGVVTDRTLMPVQTAGQFGSIGSGGGCANGSCGTVSNSRGKSNRRR